MLQVKGDENRFLDGILNRSFDLIYIWAKNFANLCACES